jgi:8-amino-7-oxononanoate synthase
MDVHRRLRVSFDSSDLHSDVFAKAEDSRVQEYRAAETLGINPYYQQLESDVGPSIAFRGKVILMLGSNNYLGLTTDARVRTAAHKAIDQYGTGVSGSRLLNGTLPLHVELEELLSDWMGTEAALVFTTGYAANLGLIGALVGPNDAAVVDSAVHASLVDGARFSEGTLRAFAHNRPNALIGVLRRWRERPESGGALVAVDGVYSMEGDWAPLVEIAAACQAHGARVLVDEAHALGVVGKRGAGTASALGVRPDLLMGTFSKSLASCGGFVAGPQSVIDYLKVACRPLLFSAAGVPAALAAALEASRIAQAENWRREAVIALSERLRRGLAQLGFDVGRSQHPSAIVPVHVGDEWEAARMWSALLESGVYTNCVVSPAVPRAMLRTSVMATHTDADIDRALDSFALVGPPRS